MKLSVHSIKFFLVVILVLLAIRTAVSQHYSAIDSTLVINKTDINIYELLDLIETKGQLNLTYSPGQIDENLTIGSCITPCSIRDYLNIIANIANLQLSINNSDVYLFKNRIAANNDTGNSISGFVKDYETGEALLGATIYSLGKKTGKTSNENGYFYFGDIPDGDTIKISYVGYSPLYIQEDKSLQSDFYLKKSNLLNEVIINSKAKQNELAYVDFDNYKSLIELGENTSSLGNNDALQELTKNPGIAKINDLQGGVSVNGLAPHDNVYLLDGIRIFEPNHIFGLFSSFSQSSINKVSLYSNYSPLSYSNAFSGLINSHLVEGNYKKHTLDFNITNSSVGLFVSGPLLKYKTTYFIDVRKSILNFYIPRLVKKKLNFENIDFYDMNFKITHRISMGNKINIFFYKGRDNIRINNSFEKLKISNRYNWGNFAYGLKWAFLFNNSIKTDLVFALSSYNNNSNSVFEFSKNPFEKSYLSIFSLTDIEEVSFKHNFRIYSNKNVFNLGYKYSKYSLLPTLKGKVSENTIEVQPDKDSTYNDIAAYLSNEYTYAKFKLSSGIKTGYLYNSHSGKIYFNSKIKLDFKVNDHSLLNIAFMKSSKFIHSLGSYSVGIPSMIWAISGDDLPISESYNYSLNYIYSNYRFTIMPELYFKRLLNVLQYKNISDIFNPVSAKGVVLPTFSTENDINNNIVTGNGRAYGINIAMKYKFKRLAVNYSFAINKVFFLFDGINHSNEFEGKYDLNYSSFFGLRYKSGKLLFLFDWHLHSGQVFSIPEYIYRDINNNEVLDYSLRNNKRMDYYNSVSLGINYTMQRGHVVYNISAGISNILNSFNPVYAYLYREDDIYRVSQVSGLPILPYLKINIKI